MTRLGFYAARLMRDETALARLSVPGAELFAALSGRSVALVGNARALAHTAQGARIDAADLVVRINRAPMPSPQSHGSRTDWLALATRLSDQDKARIAPGRILWMSHKRKRLDWRTAHGPGFYLHPLDAYHDLRDRLAAPPTTGAMMIDLLLRSHLERLALHGFDFFASQSLSGSRSAAQVPHDFQAEAAWVRDLAQHDDRLIIYPTTDTLTPPTPSPPLPSGPCLR
ncbi:glycosyltransferase family 29 protein [Paracoccus sp. Z330]|uniref:Glycosyltransferase family 29 protein n=1 Tax=Paracoccus onchidii TaxID=3017813 RepID=A0ABT4ZFK7_9RHOB|nr:glycosyltransferase family 29 protein [Paracoccus onchidii]MDB6178101.1 glycosyltransferase family 29 protein [Paracoccus onchidii]